MNRLMGTFTSLLCACVSSGGAGAAEYAFTRIYETTGETADLGIPSVNRCGMTVGSIQLSGAFETGAQAILYGDGGSHGLLGYGLRDFNYRVVVSHSSEVAFWAETDGGEQILLANLKSASLNVVAAEGEEFVTMAPFGDPFVNVHGQVAFGASKSDGAHGMYVGDGNSIETIAETLTPGKFYDSPSLNAHGRVAYRCTYPSGSVALYLSAPGPDQLVAFTGFPPFVELFNPSLNDLNQVAFVAVVDYGVGPIRGIFRGGNGDAIPLVEAGGAFADIGSQVSINNQSVIAFYAELSNGGGGGIFTGYDPVEHKVIQTGDPLDGSTVEAVTFQSSQGINDKGQIVFRAQLADGRSGVYRADPLPLSCPEDLDGDGLVNQSDLGIVVAFLGTSAAGDTNCDGMTDQGDLGQVLARYGKGCNE
jgi:hypothetical protein